MNVLFEEDGAFKAASILTDNDSSLQVETPSGRRAKIKAANVLLRFREPGCGDLLDAAEAQAEAIDTEFLYEVSGEAEFGFGELAGEYFGHPPDAVESTAILLRLHSAPIWFHRKGKGRFRKAPPEILQAALAGLEKKKLQAAAVERMTGELLAGQLPAEFPPMLEQLLYKPDRNRLEVKALEAACGESGLSVPKLLARAGGAEPRRTTTTSAASCSSSFPRVPTFRRMTMRSSRPTCRWPRCAPSPSTMRRPPRSTTRCRSRRATAAAGASASISRHPVWASRPARRSTQLPGGACPPCTCRAARSPCCRIRWSSASRWPRARACRRCRSTST